MCLLRGRTGYLYTVLRSAHTAVFMCFMWISEQTAIISLYSINWLVCVTETECVYCGVRTGSLYTTLRSAHTAVFMCFVWISEQTAIISLYNINWLVCIAETENVYCAVRTESVTPPVYGSFSPVTTYRALWKVISAECVISYCSGTRILSSNPNRDIIVQVCLIFLYIYSVAIIAVLWADPTSKDTRHMLGLKGLVSLIMEGLIALGSLAQLLSR